MTIKIYSHFEKEEDDVLREISQEISKDEINTEKTKKIVKDMFQFIVEQPDGAGLSAPQIGINKRIFVINPKMFDYDKNGELVQKNKKKSDCVYINPEIIKSSKEIIEMEEGCFSVRWEYGKVERPEKIKMKYFDLEGKKKEIGLSGFLAAVAQHEIDHLNGILFIDKATDIYRLSEEEIQKIKNAKV